MKVQKRDGRVAEYDKMKIVRAITKANAEVPDKEKVENNSIESIVKYIEKYAENKGEKTDVKQSGQWVYYGTAQGVKDFE